jgi:hypothetical protein
MNGEPVSSEHIDVGAYALGLLGPEDRRAFEEHLDGCPVCQADLAGFSGMKDLLTGIGPVPSATEEPTEAEVVDLVRRRARDQRSQRRHRVWQVGLSAAAAVVLVAGAVFVGRAVAGQPAPTTALQGQVHTATSQLTGVTGTVGLVPKTWGTAVTLQLFHVSGPLKCELVAVPRTGKAEVMGFWQVPHAHFGELSNPHPLVIVGPMGIKIGNLLKVEVIVAPGGRTLVSIPTPQARTT